MPGYNVSVECDRTTRGRHFFSSKLQHGCLIASPATLTHRIRIVLVREHPDYLRKEEYLIQFHVLKIYQRLTSMTSKS